MRVKETIRTGTVWINMYADVTGGVCPVSVDNESVSTSKYPPNLSFEAQLSRTIPSSFNLRMLFPRYRVSDVATSGELVLETHDYGNVEALCAKINSILLTQEEDDTAKYRQRPIDCAVCWRDTVFTFSGLPPRSKMRFYLYWAEQIAVTKENNRERTFTGSIPVVVVTDGHYGIRTIYPLETRDGTDSQPRHIDPKKLRFGMCANMAPLTIFNCDSPRAEAQNSPPPLIIKLDSEAARIRRVAAMVTPLTLDDSSSAVVVGQEIQEEEDRVAEFFAQIESMTPRRPSAPGLEDHVREAVAADRHRAALAREQSQQFSRYAECEIMESDGEIPTSLRFTDTNKPLISVDRHTRVPIGMFKRSDHRSASYPGRIPLKNESRTLPPLEKAKEEYASTTDSEPEPNERF